MNNLDKNKVYCPQCLKELNLNTQTKLYEYNCECYKNKRFNYISAYCNKCNKFTQRRGTMYPLNRCNRCAVILQHKTMLEKDPESYKARQANATRYANAKMKAEGKGVWSKEQHIQAEATKRKNGTDLGNKEFRKKIGCNGNPLEVIEKQKKLGIGIFRDDIRNNHKPGNCAKCGKFCNQRNAFGIGVDCGCLEKMGFKPSFKEINGILHYFDKSSSTYIPWSDYKLKFSRARVTYDISNFISKLKNLDIFQPKNMGPVDSYNLDDIIKLYPTFRMQDSEDWSGSRGAFEQNLVENNINWFTYIKFYIDTSRGENNIRIRPIVVGKSGSLNVNESGSDLSFSIDINDGPARQYLADTDFKWDKTQVLIIKAKSEAQAMYYEYRIQKVFNLFES